MSTTPLKAKTTIHTPGQQTTPGSRLSRRGAMIVAGGGEDDSGDDREPKQYALVPQSCGHIKQSASIQLQQG